MDHPLADPSAYFHVRIIMGMVLGLSITRLLTGVSVFVQHPGKNRVSWLHLGWAAFIFLFVIHFWWFEFRLQRLEHISFEVYAFVIFYSSLLFLLCCLLFPNDIAEYDSYEDYFMQRRKWFFGLLAFTFLADLVDTAIKGRDYFLSLGMEYPLRNAVAVVLCIVAIAVANRRVHVALVALVLLYQASWILRAYGMLA
jgi:hypothetical protein